MNRLYTYKLYGLEFLVSASIDINYNPNDINTAFAHGKIVKGLDKQSDHRFKTDNELKLKTFFYAVKLKPYNANPFVASNPKNKPRMNK